MAKKNDKPKTAAVKKWLTPDLFILRGHTYEVTPDGRAVVITGVQRSQALQGGAK